MSNLETFYESIETESLRHQVMISLLGLCVDERGNR